MRLDLPFTHDFWHCGTLSKFLSWLVQPMYVLPKHTTMQAYILDFPHTDYVTFSDPDSNSPPFHLFYYKTNFVMAFKYEDLMVTLKYFRPANFNFTALKLTFVNFPTPCMRKW